MLVLSGSSVSVGSTSMQAAVSQPIFRGVSCLHCGKPVRLSASFIRRETAIKQNEQSLNQELCSRVFPARCRACHAEAIYTLSQVVDFPETR
jgi:hypothetical protein